MKKPKTKLWLVRDYYEGPANILKKDVAYVLLRSEKPPVLKKSGHWWLPLGRNKAYLCAAGMRTFTDLVLPPGYYQEVELVTYSSLKEAEAQSKRAMAVKHLYGEVDIGEPFKEGSTIYCMNTSRYSLRVWNWLTQTTIPDGGLFFSLQPRGGW